MAFHRYINPSILCYRCTWKQERKGYERSFKITAEVICYLLSFIYNWKLRWSYNNVIRCRTTNFLCKFLLWTLELRRFYVCFKTLFEHLFKQSTKHSRRHSSFRNWNLLYSCILYCWSIPDHCSYWQTTWEKENLWRYRCNVIQAFGICFKLPQICFHLPFRNWRHLNQSHPMFQLG